MKNYIRFKIVNVNNPLRHYMYWETINGISINTLLQMHLTINSNQFYNFQVIETLSARNITGCLCDLSSNIICI